MGNCTTSSPRDYGELPATPTSTGNNQPPTPQQSTFGEYTWTVRGNVLKQMKRANAEEKVLSPTFLIAALSWRLVAYPNGIEGRKGSFDLFVSLLSMPPAWKHIECCIRIQCHETKCSWTMYQQYNNGSSRGWTKNTMSFQEIQSLNTMTFSVHIWVHKIVLNSNLSLFERIIPSKHHQIRWNVDQHQLQRIKSAHDGSKIESKIFDEMWCLQIHKLSMSTNPNSGITHSRSNSKSDGKRSRSVTPRLSLSMRNILSIGSKSTTNHKRAYFMVFLQSCALPRGMREYKVLWDVECILKGPKIDKRVHYSKTNVFSIVNRSNFALIWDPDDLPMSEVQKCELLELNLTVVPSNASQAVDHWNRVTDATIDEKENENPLKSTITPLSVQNDYDQITNMESVDIPTAMAMMQSMQLKFEEMQQQIMSMDQRIKSVQKEEKYQEPEPQNDLMMKQIEILKKEMSSLKQRQFSINALKERDVHSDDEKEDSEQERMREWMLSELNLIQYLRMFRENGFEDLESVQEMKEGDLIAMGIDKAGHRRKIMKHVRALKERNRNKLKMRSRSEPSNVSIAPIAPAYEFSVEPDRLENAEGHDLVDTFVKS